jgi:hypothetical protein
VRLPEYLEATGESQSSLAKRASEYVSGHISQRTVARAVLGEGIQARTAYGIIQASVDRPAPCGGAVTLRDLVLEAPKEQ